MSLFNGSTASYEFLSQIWPSGVGEDTELAGENEYAYRRLVVGKGAGPLTIVTSGYEEITISADQLTKLGGIIDGQIAGVLATSTTGVASQAWEILACR